MDTVRTVWNRANISNGTDPVVMPLAIATLAIATVISAFAFRSHAVRRFERAVKYAQTTLPALEGLKLSNNVAGWSPDLSSQTKLIMSEEEARKETTMEQARPLILGAADKRQDQISISPSFFEDVDSVRADLCVEFSRLANNDEEIRALAVKRGLIGGAALGAFMGFGILMVELQGLVWAPAFMIGNAVQRRRDARSSTPEHASPKV